MDLRTHESFRDCMYTCALQRLSC